MKQTNNFKLVLYIVLALVSIIFLALGKIYPETNSLCENLAAGSIWTLFTVMVIDKISQISQKEESKKIRYMAFKNGVETLKLSLEIWTKITLTFGNSEQKKLTSTEIEALISKINFDHKCPGAHSWTDYLQNQANQIQRYIDKTLKFESFLDLDYVYALGELDDCDLLDTIRVLHRSPHFETQIKIDLPSYLQHLHNLHEQLHILEPEFKKISPQTITVPELNF